MATLDHFYVTGQSGAIYRACDLGSVTLEYLASAVPDGGTCPDCARLVAQSETAVEYAHDRGITPRMAVAALNMPSVVGMILA